jgi:ribonuclease P protein component
MLPKIHRADTKTVEQIFKEGKFLNFPSFTFKFILTNTAERKISVLVPKSLAKLAVKRNFLRRRGYNILKKYINLFPAGLTGVLIFKKYQDDILIMENEIKNILAKTN